MISYGVAVHGGVGSPEEFSDGCKAACEAAILMLEPGGNALDAAIEAARIMEDDGRFNAGSGSALRIDGKTIEMDAAVMDSEGNMGAVINIRGVKNPVLVARAVLGTPHVAMAGRGAEAFARRLGFEPYYNISKRALEAFEETKNNLKNEDPFWAEAKISGSDTIGAVVLDKNGVFAVAVSTGGAAPMMVGRVGDTPMPGCGFYAGPLGAVAVTGLGEESIRKMLAKTVYDLFMAAEDMDAQAACEKGLSLFQTHMKMGILALTKNDSGVAATNRMAKYSIIRAV